MSEHKHVRHGWWDTPICPVLTCSGPGTMDGCSLRCTACGECWTGTAEEIAKAKAADAMWAKFEDRREPRRPRRRSAPMLWLPGITRRVEAQDPRVLVECGMLRLPLGVSIALSLVGSHGARVILRSDGSAEVYGGGARVAALMRPIGAIETTLCNVPAWVWTR